ncbi:ADP-ribosylglycohydrolase family protein [Anaeromassilibacillus sp. An200]|uniref:ADP-ribosylglycohydrolase family protein n=1 Tax=Eubacteriales TaxID=186802 RepID=UPI001FA8BEB6|nr:ADP-ribosylglycohydrolase family protein [Anaeromassilibacillus sp. An200]
MQIFIYEKSMRDRYRGCLVGGAAGDALGYTVEFLTLEEIRARYGADGIRDYECTDGMALISDDTQMTLFTAEGLLRTCQQSDPILSCPSCISASYQDWLITQTKPFSPNKIHTSQLLSLPELYQRRAPGNTCLDALESGRVGSITNAINQSKGCGGVMRVAPIGLFFAKPDTAGTLAATVAAQTHGHVLGYLPAGILAWCISRLSHGEKTELVETIRSGLVWAKKKFSFAPQEYAVLEELVERAILLANEKIDDTIAIASLGEGWVAEETLAIAVYCAIRYRYNFGKALCAAVNHNGDSDSTGAVTGNLLGASLGLKQLPNQYLQSLELKETILEFADQLYRNTQLEKSPGKNSNL